MAAIRLVRLGISVLCDCLINECTKSLKKEKGLEPFLALIFLEYKRPAAMNVLD